MGEEDVSDRELDRLAARIRSFRRRESVAKSVGTGVALVLGVLLYASTHLVFGDSMLERTRLTIASIGILAGVAAYRALMPKEDPADID